MDLYTMQCSFFAKELKKANGSGITREGLIDKAKQRLGLHKKGLNQARRDNYNPRGRALIGEFLDTQQYGNIAAWGMPDTSGKTQVVRQTQHVL